MGGRISFGKVGEKEFEFFERNPERSGEVGPMPGLRVVVCSFPPPYRRRIYTQDLSQTFLAEAHSFAALRQTKPFHDHPFVRGSRPIDIDPDHAC
jgi:hypothetical protein